MFLDQERNSLIGVIQSQGQSTKKIPRTLTVIRKKEWANDWMLMKPTLQDIKHKAGINNESIRYSDKVKHPHNWQLGNLGIMCFGTRNYTANLLISYIIKHFSKVKCLELSTRNQYFTIMSEDMIKSIVSNIVKNLKQLRNLSLAFEGCNNLTDDGLISIVSRIARQLPHLKKLKLNFAGCRNITDFGLDQLKSEMRNLKNLHSFNLCFSACEQITENGIRNIGSSINKRLKLLQQLSLDFSCCNNIKNMGIYTMGYYIGSIPQLRKLKLILNNSNIKELSNGLGGEIGMLSFQLQHLSLSFFWPNQLTEQEADSLVCSLVKHLVLIRLDKLELKFGYCLRITTEGIETLVSKVAKNIPQLKTLRLSFTNCGDFADKGLNNLGLSITDHLTNLHELRLEFPNAHHVTADGIEAFIQLIARKLMNLKRLKLVFTYSGGITQETVDFVCSELVKNLHQLRKIELDFGKYTEINQVKNPIAVKSGPKLVTVRQTEDIIKPRQAEQPILKASRDLQNQIKFRFKKILLK